MAILAGMCQTLIAQETTGKKKYQKFLKVYGQQDVSGSRYAYESNSFYRRNDDLTDGSLAIKNLGVALQWTNKKGHFHEIGVSHFIHGRGISSALWLQPSSIGLKYRQLTWRYEKAYSLASTRSFGFYLGYSLTETIRHRMDSYSSGFGTVSELNVLFTRLHAVPRIVYELSNKWTLDLNFPFELYLVDVALYKAGFQQPNSVPITHISMRQGTNIGRFEARLGIAYRL